jgi:hypothetical protein
LRVARDQDPHRRGIELVAEVNKLLSGKTIDDPEIVDPAKLLGPNAVPFTASAATTICGRDAVRCLPHYQARLPDIRRWTDENAILLKRYRSLYAYPHFREIVQPHIQAPIFIDPAQVVNLARAKAAAQAIQGDTNSALRSISEDIRFWRHALVETRTLIHKMIAVASVLRDARLASEIIAAHKPSRTALAQARDAVQPLTNPERRFENVYRFEFTRNKWLFSNLEMDMHRGCGEMDAIDCALQRLSGTFLLKTNATINQQYGIHKKLAQLSELPAPEYLKRIHDGAFTVTDPLWSWDMAYNPFGKILVNIAVPAYYLYPARLHNLDGLLRLIALQLDIQQQGLHGHAINTYLEQSDVALRNPYTLEPMQFDAAARSLAFMGMREKDGAADELLSHRVEIRL